MPTSDRMPATVTSHTPFTSAQTTKLIVLGVALWFGFAMAIRFIGADNILDGGVRTVATFAILFPLTVPVVAMIRRTAQLSPTQLLPGLGLVTMAATLCDGLTFTWFPQLYGVRGAEALPVSAAILWGAGVGLAVAWVMGRRAGA
jgi:hypothetical protein